MRFSFSKSARTAFTFACLFTVLVGCVSRPTDDALIPVKGGTALAQEVTIIAATNRAKSETGNGYKGEWAGSISFERLSFSVPTKRDGTKISYPAKIPNRQRQYFVTQREAIAENTFIREITSAPAFDGSVALFVHGYNNNFAEAVYRTAQMAADVHRGAPPVLFSWPSAGSVVGYVADRDAALSSRSELSNVLSALANSPRIKRIEFVSHSMGAFLSMEVIRQLRLQGRTKVLDKLEVVLASPDIDVDVFRSQLRDIGAIRTPITLLVSKSDRALFVSGFLAGSRERVGKVNVSDPEIIEAASAERIRVIDISSLKSVDGLGHDRFATFAQHAGQLVQGEVRNSENIASVGAYVFDAAGVAASSPFRLAAYLSRP